MMANLTIKISNTGEKFPISEIDLNEVINEELLSQMVSVGAIPQRGSGISHRLLGKYNTHIDQVGTLASLGFNDGDETMVILK